MEASDNHKNSELEKEAVARYGRSSKIKSKYIKNIKNKKLRAELTSLQGKYKNAAINAKNAELLLEYDSGFLEPEGPLERTYKVRQNDLTSEIAIETAKKSFQLKLTELGPYKASYTRNGKHLLLAGRKGHVAAMDWRNGQLLCEIQLQETLRDATWLHNSLSFAVAQKKYTFIYDQDGVEIHRLDNHIDVTHMEFLPYHFLLATIGNAGHLKYIDTSTGKMIADFRTKLGSPTAFRQNPHNAVINVGHQNGTVTLWSPNSSTPLVKILAHRGPVRSIAIDKEGRYMVSAGSDMKMAVWDIRKLQPLNTYFTRQPGSSVDISDRNLTAVGWGTQVSVWRGLFDKAGEDQERVTSPYMGWRGDGQRIEQARWCPFEDILGLAHDQGFTSLLIPGAGEANFDALEINPYETTKQRQEGEVKQLLNKLQPGMISLDPNFVASLDLASHQTRLLEKDADRKPNDKLDQLKNRGRGRNSALRRVQRKQGFRNIIDEQKLRIQELRKKQNSKLQENLQRQERQYGPALQRFASKEAS